MEISDLHPLFCLWTSHLLQDWEAEHDWVTAQVGDGLQGGQKFLQQENYKGWIKKRRTFFFFFLLCFAIVKTLKIFSKYVKQDWGGDSLQYLEVQLFSRSKRQGNWVRTMGSCTCFSNSQENKCHCCSPHQLLHSSLIVTKSLTNYKHFPQFISPVRFFCFSSSWKEKAQVSSSPKIYSSNASEWDET